MWNQKNSCSFLKNCHTFIVLKNEILTVQEIKFLFSQWQWRYNKEDKEDEEQSEKWVASKPKWWNDFF